MNPRAYPDRPFVGVGVVVLKDDEVLVVRRGKPPLRPGWSIPGGAQEIGETTREAGAREVLEETGVEIEIIGLIDVIDAITRDDDGRVRFHYTLVDYAALWRAGEPKADDDVAEARFVPFADLDEVEMWTETRRVIRAAVGLRDADEEEAG